MLLKIGNTEKPKAKKIIVTPDLPNAIDYILLTNGTCIISAQFAKKLGGQIHD